MRGRLLAIILLFSIISCSEETLPDGIYDYQVERLLSGELGNKTWSQIINTTNCADSLKLTFELIPDNTDDSLDISMVSGCFGALTTTYVGRASASVRGTVLFSDSLIFSNGDFWIVDQVTSERFRFSLNDQTLNYSSSD
ncbi:hypothetical protein [Ekhidna sp.]